MAHRLIADWFGEPIPHLEPMIRRPVVDRAVPVSWVGVRIDLGGPRGDSGPAGPRPAGWPWHDRTGRGAGRCRYGKTRALTHRVAYGVATGVMDPRRALVVTFTTRAAGSSAADCVRWV